MNRRGLGGVVLFLKGHWTVFPKVNFLPYCNRPHTLPGMVQGPDSHKILSPPVILSMKRKMVAKVISEVKSVSGLKLFQKLATGQKYLK